MLQLVIYLGTAGVEGLANGTVGRRAHRISCVMSVLFLKGAALFFSDNLMHKFLKYPSNFLICVDSTYFNSPIYGHSER